MKEHRDACEKGIRELGSSRPCMGEPPLNPLGGDHSPGPQQRTGAVGEGGPAHPDDTLRVALQLERRTGSSWLLDHCDEEAGRSSFYRPLTSNNVYSQECMTVNSSV